MCGKGQLKQFCFNGKPVSNGIVYASVFFIFPDDITLRCLTIGNPDLVVKVETVIDFFDEELFAGFIIFLSRYSKRYLNIRNLITYLVFT